MSTTLVKGLAAVATLGTASGVGTLVYLNTRDSTTIDDKLSEKGLTKITKQDDYKFHLFDTKNQDKLKQALGLTAIDHKQHASNLEKWCQDNLKKNVSEDKDNSIFENAKAFCFVPKIKTLGQKVKGTLHEDGDWKAKYAGFAKDRDNKERFINALKVDFSTVNFAASDFDGGPNLKVWCEKTLKINTYDVDEYRSEANFKAWCIKTPA